MNNLPKYNKYNPKVWDPKSGEMSVTNVFQFTFELRDQNPAQIIPKTYHEVNKLFRLQLD